MNWPKQAPIPPAESSEEEREICLLTTAIPKSPFLSIDHYSSFTKLKCVTTWILQFVNNCCSHKNGLTRVASCLTVKELATAETYWQSISQQEHFTKEIDAIQREDTISNSSCLLPLHHLIDSSGQLCVDGREQNSNIPYSS